MCSNFGALPLNQIVTEEIQTEILKIRNAKRVSINIDLESVRFSMTDGNYKTTSTIEFHN